MTHSLTMRQRFLCLCNARWQFEKTSIDLYNHVLRKCPADMPDLKVKFEKIRNDEVHHLETLERIIHRYGGDPHTYSPAVNFTKLEFKGFNKVVEGGDFPVAVEALLEVGLLDTFHWETLFLVTQQLGDSETQSEIEAALKEETEHLRFLHDYVTRTILQQFERKAA